MSLFIHHNQTPNRNPKCPALSSPPGNRSFTCNGRMVGNAWKRCACWTVGQTNSATTPDLSLPTSRYRPFCGDGGETQRSQLMATRWRRRRTQKRKITGKQICWSSTERDKVWSRAATILASSHLWAYGMDSNTQRLNCIKLHAIVLRRRHMYTAEELHENNDLDIEWRQIMWGLTWAMPRGSVQIRVSQPMNQSINQNTFKLIVLTSQLIGEHWIVSIVSMHATYLTKLCGPWHPCLPVP